MTDSLTIDHDNNEHGIRSSAPQFVFFNPCIPGNTGNAIRLAACTGTTLHLIKPLGFEMDDARLKRAGLDYHDLSHYQIHEDFEAFLATIPDTTRIFAFSSHATHLFSEPDYRSDDILLFGPEPSGLPPEILNHPRITQTLRIPMVEGVRSLNLAVSASLAVYRAWEELNFD
jgi:tRNA (cytidine/uridine-2'-O-)-methyltransferase